MITAKLAMMVVECINIIVHRRVQTLEEFGTIIFIVVV
jgi:hypothetical protein